MKLLIITQKVEKEDDVLGFFHRWIEKFSQKVEKINVICLFEGKHNFFSNLKLNKSNVEQQISNVFVWSLGKETGRSRLKYIFRFYKYIWQLRKDYDVVFVHMNPIYIVLGGFLWRFWGKKIFLWYNHQHGNLILKIAVKFTKKIFYTSPFAFTARYKTSERMPAGIDTEIFKKDEKIQKIPNSILYLGRISPIKNVDILIEAVKLLDKEGIDFILNIVGEPGEKDKDYFKKIKKLSKELEVKGKIKFWGKVPNYKTPEIYNQNEILVNLSPPGLFDKTVLEAMACENLILVSSAAFKDILEECFIFYEGNPLDLKNKILNLFKKEKKEKEALSKKLREVVVQNHNLDILIEKLIKKFE
ncbi:MAG: glycosyltransferase family 4 protein [candidate division WOR-3 bacterium]